MKRIFALCLLFSLSLSTFAQQGGNTKTVEELYLETSVEVQVIKSLAGELSRDSKKQALEVIASMVESGKANQDNLEILGVLDELGGEGTNKEVRVNGRLMNDYPEIRRLAAELLGQIGGEKSRDILINMALNEKEPMVLAETVYSLGLIKPDSTGRVESIIAQLVKSQDARSPDNNFAYAAISALENVGKARKGQVNPEVFVSLIQIAQGNYIRAVRTKAIKILDEFRKY